MGTESEELRLSVQYRLTKIEQQVAQLVLDHAQIHNTIANLRKIVQILQNYKLKMDVRTEDAYQASVNQAKQSERRLKWIGVVIAGGTLLIEFVFKFWKP